MLLLPDGALIDLLGSADRDDGEMQEAGEQVRLTCLGLQRELGAILELGVLSWGRS